MRSLPPIARPVDVRTARPPAKTADPHYLTPEHRRFRDAVLERAGYRCEAVENGQRCPRTSPPHRLFADHVVELADGGAPFDPDNGRCLCGKHHSRKTADERALRTARRPDGG